MLSQPVGEPIKAFVKKVIYSPESFTLEKTHEFIICSSDDTTTLTDKDTNFQVSKTVMTNFTRDLKETTHISTPFFSINARETALLCLVIDDYKDYWQQSEKDRFREEDKQKRDKWCKIYGVSNDD